ncbi:hypothetical protein BKA81DRAFT_371706 [Phyllosticta paracitricarpa]
MCHDFFKPRTAATARPQCSPRPLLSHLTPPAPLRCAGLPARSSSLSSSFQTRAPSFAAPGPSSC